MYMQVAVWDTYVDKQDGSVMHFDIIAPREIEMSDIYRYGMDYLNTKGLQGLSLTSKECQFCHVETVNPDWEADIVKKGYFVYEMENCG